MSDIFNTPFEVSLRIILLLDAIGDQRETVDRISIIDFMSVYGEDFGASSSNLHGDNHFRFGEFALRRDRVEKALKLLVLDGLVKAASSENGFLYSITANGSLYCQRLDSNYADEYHETVRCVNKLITNQSERQIAELIQQQSISELQRSDTDD
jgi:hypothetical protein